ncbi:MAG: YbaN family protein [Acidimicrobiia bacterium]
MSSVPTAATDAPPVRARPIRWMWFAIGWVAVAIGFIGIVVPGLPTTVFFVVAASCFAKSSPRFEQWVLELPKVGPLVRDYRAGLGMSRRAKAFAIFVMWVFVAISIVFTVEHPAIRLGIAALAVVGTLYILFRVPTRERVLEQRSS